MTAGACRELTVVVPAYNEEKWISGALRALAEQTDTGFTLVVVDNGSTDDTPGVVRAFARDTPLDVRLVDEPEPGAGTAADTGFRARRHTDRIVRADHLIVEASLRRLRAWGPRRTLLWHWDRRYRPASVHVR